MEKARSLPGAMEELMVLFYSGNCCYFARQYDEAAAYDRRVLSRNQAIEAPHTMLAKCYLRQGRLDDALAELDAAEAKQALIGEHWLSQVHLDRGRICALRGETQRAEEQLALLMGGTTRQNRRLCAATLLYDLGRTEEAWKWLEDAVDAREPHIIALLKVPDVPDGMRADPRFRALLKRVGLGDKSGD